MQIKSLLIIFLFSLFSFVQDGNMSSSEIKSFKANVEKESKDINTIKTDFVQTKHMDFLSKDIVSNGTMYFKKPNVLSWNYATPFKYSIIFKNNKVYIDDNGKKSSVDGKIFEKINKLIVGSVSGNMFDEKEFSISYSKSKEFYLVKLSPKTSVVKKYIKQIELSFNIKDYMVSSVKLFENETDFTKITFKNRIINAVIDEKYFNH